MKQKKEKKRKIPNLKLWGLGLWGILKENQVSLRNITSLSLLKEMQREAFSEVPPFSLKVEFPKVPQLYESPP